MLDFNSTNPYPLLREDECTYAQEKEHSAKVDEWLGFDFSESEKFALTTESLDQELWKNLPIFSLQTPYTEIRRLLEILSPKAGETIMDLGCAYGRMAFVVAAHFKKVQFKGYEFIESRVREGQRILTKHYPEKNLQLEQQDLADLNFKLPRAEYYFMYDFGSVKAIEKICQDLREISKLQKITVIGRGRRTRAHVYDYHPWLTGVNEPRNFSNFSIFTAGG